MPKYTVSIAEPCHEKWEGMTATGCGAFCSSCQKEVIDFRGKSSFEIADVLKKNLGGTCGRLTKEQLNFVYELIPDKPAKAMWFRKGVIGAALAFLVSVFNTKAESVNDKPIIEAVDKIGDGKLPVPINDEPVDTNKIIIKGVVLNELNEPFAYATVIFVTDVANQTIGVTTDMEGRFNLEISSDKIKGNTIHLKVTAMGYSEKELIITLKQASDYQTIIMEDNYMDIMGLMIIEVPEDKAPTTPIEHELWWGLKFGIWE